MLERKKFVEEYERGVYSVAELCRRFGISRKTGYTWLKRFDEGGAAELADRGRRPRNSPNAVEPRIAAALLSARSNARRGVRRSCEQCWRSATRRCGCRR